MERFAQKEDGFEARFVNSDQCWRTSVTKRVTHDNLHEITVVKIGRGRKNMILENGRKTARLKRKARYLRFLHKCFKVGM